jgi:UDP-N-acetylmuramate--alanine ligase
MGGLHNIENAVVAIAVAHLLGIEDEKIKKAVASFRGVKRRFEYVLPPSGLTEGPVFIDDYAHHPEELKALIKSAKNLFPGKKCVVIFQPHLFTRTRDFADGFAESLDLADQVVLLPIYPARELPIEGVTSKIIADRMKKAKVYLMKKDELMEWLQAQPLVDTRLELLITAGAGDIDTLVKPIKEIFEKTN